MNDTQETKRARYVLYRMQKLWGKNVMGWARRCERAFETLVRPNDK